MMRKSNFSIFNLWAGALNVAMKKTEREYDLEERTFAFAKRTIQFTRQARRDIANVEVIKQLVRSAGSVGANYIEANEALSRKDFAYRIKICKKEAKESGYWLRLIEMKGNAHQDERRALIQETSELVKIFAAILRNMKT